jgi:hypothetical protein
MRPEYVNRRLAGTRLLLRFVELAAMHAAGAVISECPLPLSL